MNNKTKLIKTAKVCGIVAKIAYLISSVACVVFLVLAIVFPLVDVWKSVTRTETAIIFSVFAVYAFVMVGLLWNVEKLFDTMKKLETPFSATINRYLKKIAVFTLILSCVPALLGSTLLHALAPNSVFEFRIELVGVLMSIVLFLLGQVFAYGKELQQKDDETL